MAVSPLRFLMPANHGDAAWIFTSTYGGGLVGGDSISIRVTVGDGARAFVSTQASTKVYRSPAGAEVEVQAHIASNGQLVVIPDPVVCFADSRYRQAQRIDIADSGSVVLVDWISSGRRAAGERWAFNEYVSRTTVRYGGRLVVYDSLALRETDGDLAARMGRFDVLAMVVMVGAVMRSHAARITEQVHGGPVVRQPDELLAASSFGEIGCIVRIAGRSVEQVGGRMRQLLGFVPRLLGDDPWSRKW
jgi:urease accessory protein